MCTWKAFATCSAFILFPGWMVLAWVKRFPHFLFVSKELIYLLLFYSVASLSVFFSRYLYLCWYLKYHPQILLSFFVGFFVCFEFFKILREEINLIGSALSMSIVSHFNLFIFQNFLDISAYNNSQSTGPYETGGKYTFRHVIRKLMWSI